MVGAEVLGDGPGVLGLVIARVLEADGEGLDRRARSAPASSATTVEESIPPERKTPSGTSASIRSLTASRRSMSRRSIASSAEPEEWRFASALGDVSGRPVRLEYGRRARARAYRG